MDAAADRSTSGLLTFSSSSTGAGAIGGEDCVDRPLSPASVDAEHPMARFNKRRQTAESALAVLHVWETQEVQSSNLRQES